MIRRELFDKLVEEGKMERGVIEGFQGSWMSGLATLIISGRHIPCDNGPTVRALEAAFGGVIAPGHTVNVGAIRGREIYYSTNFVLEAFTPVDCGALDDEVDNEEAERTLSSEDEEFGETLFG